jgi:riboflavin synthase
VFTGLIQDLGTVAGVRRSDDGALLTIESALARELRAGDSVAINGVCLTATEAGDNRFAAQVMNETLERSSLRGIDEGAVVNLELPLRAADRLGGHVVQGHVDGVGSVVDLRDDGFSRRVTIEAPEDLLRYVVAKGSIAVDGVSLTVAALDDSAFAVALIPETLQRTNLGNAEVGTPVNLEVDVLAKYVEKLVGAAR